MVPEGRKEGGEESKRKRVRYEEEEKKEAPKPAKKVDGI